MPPFVWDTNQLGPAIILALISLIIGAVLSPIINPLITRIGKSIDERIEGIFSNFSIRYKQFILNQVNFLKVQGIRSDIPVSLELENIFVEPSFQFYAKSSENPITKKTLSLVDVFKAANKIFILGGPGTGKSTLLSYIAFLAVKNQLTTKLGFSKNYLPIYIILRDVTRNIGITELPSFVDWLIGFLHSRGLNTNSYYFLSRLQKGECIIFLDGLDEVGTTESRYLLTKWMNDAISLYPNNIFLITSRPFGYESMSLSGQFTPFYLADFNSGQIAEFIHKWYMSVENFLVGGGDPKNQQINALVSAESLISTVFYNPDIERMAANPLLLSIITLVHKRIGKLSQRRVDLYSECVDVLLGYWDKAKGMDIGLSIIEKREILQILALNFHKNKIRGSRRRDIEDCISQKISNLNLAKPDSRIILETFTQRSGLLIEQEIDYFTFSHFTFQEYLAARQIWETGSIDLLLENLKDPWWEQVLILYCSMGDSKLIFEKLINDRCELKEILLIGKIASEARSILPDARKRIVNLIENAISNVSDPKIFLELSIYKSEVDGLDQLEYLFRFIEQEISITKRSAIALGLFLSQLGPVRLADALEQVLIFGVEENIYEAVFLSIGQIECSKVLNLEPAVIKKMATYFANRLKDILLLAGDTTRPLELRLAAAKVLNYAMVEVPSGNFTMGNAENYARNDEAPVHLLYLDTFFIDVCPITNIQYYLFLQETNRLEPSNWNDTLALTSEALMPVVNVTFYDCIAYAKWVGKELPSEVEWEKSARGNDERIWPWGNIERGDICNYAITSNGSTIPIASYPENKSPYGALDMAGNVWEYTRSLYQPYPYDELDGRENTTIEGYRVLRGGSFKSINLIDIRTTTRNWDIPTHNNDWSFRCLLHFLK